MKLRFLLAIGLWFCLKFCLGQNYIPNYSFEDTLPRTTPLFLPTDWFVPTNESFDYFTPFHNLSSQHYQFYSPQNLVGFQVAKTGQAYAGILLYHLWGSSSNPRREYMQVQLKRPLIFDSTYCFQLFISMADSVHFASKNMLGVYFSQNAVSANHTNHLPYIPQLVVSPNTYLTDKVNWVKIDMQYQAQGGEKYITIGNFNDTNYIDTTFVPGGGDQFWMQASYYYLDDIWLSHCDSLPESLVTGLNEPLLKQQFKVYPNPFVSEITVESEGKENLAFKLYNAIGQEVKVQVQQLGHHQQISTGHLPKGIYWLRVSDGIKSETVKLIKR